MGARHADIRGYSLKYAIFDNPHTMCREWYRDGECVASLTAEVIADAIHQGLAWSWMANRIVIPEARTAC